MKRPNLTKTLWASAIAASVAALPLALPASAQDTAPAPGATDTTTTVPYEEDDGFDWGWLGLLGLIGLAGLARKPEERVHYRDPQAGSTTTGRSDYR